jgi:hypothetical protein
MTSPLSPLEVDLLSLPGIDRNSRIVARHFGLDGKGGANFRVIGDELSLTRERVRQIMLQARPRKLYSTGSMTTLNQAIAVIAATLPARASEVETKLVSAGVTSRLFRLEGIVNAAMLLGRRLPFSIRRFGRERFVVAQDFPAFTDIRRLARQKVRQCGMASISDLLNEGASLEAGRRERNIVKALLLPDKDLQWLDKSSEWFWFSEVIRNPALTRIRKMLCVANPLGLKDLRAGLERMSDAIPPDEALVAFCQQMPGIAVHGDSVSASDPINPGKVLNGTELDIFRTLSEQGGRMPVSDLIYRAKDLGIKRPTFYQCVSHSSIVFRHRGYYLLIGSTVQAPDAQIGNTTQVPARRLSGGDGGKGSPILPRPLGAGKVERVSV